MTQALALAGALGRAGHEVVRVFIGVSPARTLPSYFQDGLPVPVTPFVAPAQVAGRRRRGVSVAATVATSTLRVPRYAASAARIHATLDRVGDVDVVVNFMDLLSGFARAVWRPRVPGVVVGHNYLFQHPGVGPLPGGSLAQGAVLGYFRMTSLGAARRLALSYAPLPPCPGKDIEVVPPLLRRELFAVEPRDDGHLTAYTLNPGYAEVLAEWHASAPSPPPLHCFVEGGAAAFSRPTHAGFRVFDLDDAAFLDSLGRCTAYIGSAGFEALCEAHYLGKPVLAIPTERQYEQVLNAWDAQRHGVARAGTYADLDAFLSDLPVPPPDAVAAFRAWVARGPDILVNALEEVARAPRT